MSEEAVRRQRVKKFETASDRRAWRAYAAGSARGLSTHTSDKEVAAHAMSVADLLLAEEKKRRAHGSEEPENRS